MKRVFISYSLRKNDMTKEILKKIKIRFLLCKILTYIDILDTSFIIENEYFNSKIQLNHKNITSIYQENLKKELLNCKCLCLLESDGSDNSKWVKEELLFSKINKIPIIKIQKNEWISLIRMSRKEDIQKMKIITKINSL